MLLVQDFFLYFQITTMFWLNIFFYLFIKKYELIYEKAADQLFRFFWKHQINSQNIYDIEINMCNT